MQNTQRELEQFRHKNSTRHSGALLQNCQVGAMAPQGGQYEATDGDMDELFRNAVRTETKARSMREMGPDPIKTVKKQVVRHVDVPMETTVKVPVEKHVVRPHVARHTVKGTELVPVTKYREVEETHLEVQEERVKGERQCWKLVTEPYQETVKVPVEVTKTRKVPYTEYIPRTVEKVIEVPVHEISTVKGHRYDTHVGKKTVEVEQEEHYEVYPVFKKAGPCRVRELPASRDYVGRVERGRAQVPVRELPGEILTSMVDYSKKHAEAGATMKRSENTTLRAQKRSGETRRPASTPLNTSASDPRLVHTARGVDRSWDNTFCHGKSGGLSDAGSVCTQSTASTRRLLSSPQYQAACSTPRREPARAGALSLDDSGVRDKITGPPTVKLRDIVY